MASPARSAGIQSKLGILAPEVVPFWVKTISASLRARDRSGNVPYGRPTWIRQSASFNCSAASVTHSSPKLSQAKTSTGRAPSIDHSTISTAPVSEAGTMAILKSAGTPNTARVRSMASLSLALPGLERCERPSNALSSACRLQPGRFFVGPDENRASAGRIAGVGKRVIQLYSHPYRWASAVGSGWPVAKDRELATGVNWFVARSVTDSCHTMQVACAVSLTEWRGPWCLRD